MPGRNPLNRADHHAQGNGQTHQARAAEARAPRREVPKHVGPFGQERKPDVLRVAEQQLRGGQQGDAGQGRGFVAAMRRGQGDANGPQQPRQVGHDGDRIGMDEVQQVEAAEREGQRPQRGRVAPAQRPAEQQIHAGERQRVAGQQFDVERGAQWQPAVQPEVPGMVGAQLAFGCNIEAAEQLAHPVKRLAVGELLGIKVAQRQVELAQVVGHVYAAEKKRQGQHREHPHGRQLDGGGQAALGQRGRHSWLAVGKVHRSWTRGQVDAGQGEQPRRRNQVTSTPGARSSLRCG